MNRTLVISSVFPPKVGGSGRWMWELYRRLADDDVAIIAGDHPDAQRFDARHDLPIHRVPLAFSDYGTFSLTGLNRYRAAVRHAKQIARNHRATAIHCSALLPDGWVGYMVARQLGLPLLLYFHGEELCYTESSRQLKWMANRILSHCAAVIVNSRNTRQIAIQELRVPLDKLHLLHPGVDPSQLAPATPDPTIRCRLGWDDRPVLLTVGRLQKRKGHHLMLDALPAIRREFPYVVYAIVGQGEERVPLQQQVVELELSEHVRFYDEPSETELIECYQQCDLFVLPNYRIGYDVEGFGIVLLEAQACGKPVVAGHTGGTSDAMIEGESGYLTDPENKSQLASLVCELLRQRMLRESLGRAGREMTVRQFNWDVVASRAAELFAGLRNGCELEVRA